MTTMRIDLPEDLARELAALAPDGDLGAAACGLIARALRAERPSSGFESVDQVIARRVRRRFITAEEIGAGSTAMTRGTLAG